MGDMGEYWKDIKPHLKERRKQHVRKMGNSATKNIETLGFEFTHYPNNHQFAINTHNGIIDYWELQERGLSAKQKNVVKGYVV